ncbi:TIGR03086 family metal-binding protein [Nonomuraea sp. NPDC000554]|uniref:TIGR03086 family metal-binding protein n=1 Tax=Nonomuraea sp. NPDC000554 TaxID=3154259 RepID=UPI00332D6258
MTDEQTPAALLGGVALLERAVAYTLGALCLITPNTLTRPTPCAAWDVRALLHHLNDSFAALHQAAIAGAVHPPNPNQAGEVERVHVAGGGGVRCGPGDPVFALRRCASGLLGAWAGVARGRVVVGDCWLTSAMVAAVGAVEVAVHGWDVVRACGGSLPIPEPMAEELVDLAPLLVAPDDRPDRFAAPRPLPPHASAADRLLAFLGRDPHQAAGRLRRPWQPPTEGPP